MSLKDAVYKRQLTVRFVFWSVFALFLRGVDTFLVFSMLRSSQPIFLALVRQQTDDISSSSLLLHRLRYHIINLVSKQYKMQQESKGGTFITLTIPGIVLCERVYIGLCVVVNLPGNHRCRIRVCVGGQRGHMPIHIQNLRKVSPPKLTKVSFFFLPRTKQPFWKFLRLFWRLLEINEGSTKNNCPSFFLKCFLLPYIKCLESQSNYFPKIGNLKTLMRVPPRITYLTYLRH